MITLKSFEILSQNLYKYKARYAGVQRTITITSLTVFVLPAKQKRDKGIAFPAAASAAAVLAA